MAKDVTLAELQEQIAKLQAQASAIIQAEKSGVIEEIKAKISQYGISASELGFKVSEAVKTAKASGAGTSKAPSAPMYRNPETGETWHGGKGRLPLWLQALLDELKKAKPEAGNPELKQWLDENGYKIKNTEVA